MGLWAVLSSVAAAAWLIVALLPWQPHRTREQIAAADTPTDLRDVAVLIPARNEAEHLPATLAALARQGGNLQVIVIDDRSEDSTESLVRHFAEHDDGDTRQVTFQLVRGQPLRAGWGGKLWALQQGLEYVDRPYCLLLDADIVLADRMIAALLAEARRRSVALISVMATLSCQTFWERLLVPPFIFFFKLLYPFALVANPRSRVAAAAGGCILVEHAALREVGAFSAWADALIDDCTLARHVKRSRNGNGRICLLMSQDVSSTRTYQTLSEFWQMVTRTAYTQLHYSIALLFLTTAIMVIVFLAPLAAILLAGSTFGTAAGVVALVLMIADYVPVARFYRLPVVWWVSLPLSAVLFLAMTWHSAINYYSGTRAVWKSRQYDSNV